MIIFVLVTVSIAGYCFAAGNEIIYVSTTGNDTYNGLSPEYDSVTGDGPKATIQKGIDTVDDNGTVYVASGTYKENLLVNKNLILLGEDLDSTIIDGQQTGSPVLSFYGANYVEKFTFVLSGFTITNGMATNGAGLYLYNGTTALLNLLVTNNIATGGNPSGGGVYAYGTVYADNDSVMIKGNYHTSISGLIPDEVFGDIIYVDLNEELLQNQNLLGSNLVRQGSPALLENLLNQSGNNEQENSVIAANTVALPSTGIPINYFVLAILMVIGGLFLPKKK